MSWIIWDEDEWEHVTTSETYGFYPGTKVPFGSCSAGWRRRAPEDVARIKAEKQRAHDDGVLAEAERIRVRRAMI